MPYIPPHLRPRPATASAAPAPPPPRGVRFIGNATGNINVAANTGVRFSPHRNAAATRKVLKHVALSGSMNSEPPAKPTYSIHGFPPKYKSMIMKSLSFKKQKPKRRQTKKHKRSKRTMRRKYTSKK